MKTTKYISNILAIAALLCVFACSEDDRDLTYLKPVDFPEGLSATPNAVVLSSENQYQSVMTVSWPSVQFPIDAPVTYTLEVDVATDTIGETAWQNAIRIQAGEDVLSKSFIGDELNDIAHDLGLVSDEAGQLVMRVEAVLDRAVYSKAIAISVTPFTEEIAFGQIYMPGGYQGWDTASAQAFPAIAPGVYQSYHTFAPGDNLEFKFTTQPNWDNFYGLDLNGNFAESGDTNITVPGPGSYQMTVNLNTVTFTAVPYSWGIIGTATAGGWDSDSDMSYDWQTGVWKWTGTLVPGALKFRLNDSWTINYGSNNSTDFIAYLDNPGAHTIDVAGTYEVTFSHDPANPAQAIYTVVLL